MGIYTVLNEFFPPQRPPSSLKYIQYFFLAGDPCEENSSIQNCEALQSERFFFKTKENATVRLTPTVAFCCGIGEKDPAWSV